MSPERQALRSRLAEPGPVLGTWINSRSPEIVETLGWVGFDCVVLDMEHGEYGPEALPDLLRAAEVTGCSTLVRASHVAPSQIMRALDAGADGVMVPNVETAEQAAIVTQAAHYAPRGVRGAAPTGRGPRYGVQPFLEYRARVEDEVVVACQVEGPDGIARLDDILAVSGLDMVFIGAFDLAQRLGVPGETDHPRVVEAMTGIVADADRHGVATGTWAPDSAQAKTWIDAGVKLVTISSAPAMFAEAAQALLKRLHELAGRE